jgi:hypothetical protein
MIGLLIGVYTFTRLFEIATRPADGRNGVIQVLLIILCLASMAATALLCLLLLLESLKGVPIQGLPG